MFLIDADTWQIKETKKKGRGVFAQKDISAGTIVGDYLGKVISTADETKYEEDYGLYLMYYHKRATIFPKDINAPGIHLINHSCIPNLWMYTYKGHTLYFAIRHIFAGEELTTAYLLGPDETCDPCPHICICESKNCTQTMHADPKLFDTWDAFNTKVAKQTKREPVSPGKDLPKLATYPPTIPDAPVYPLFGSAVKPPLTFETTEMPEIPKLRRLIRESGRRLQFDKLDTLVLGIMNNEIISESL